jgi:hypothetical protein
MSLTYLVKVDVPCSVRWKRAVAFSPKGKEDRGGESNVAGTVAVVHTRLQVVPTGLHVPLQQLEVAEPKPGQQRQGGRRPDQADVHRRDVVGSAQIVTMDTVAYGELGRARGHRKKDEASRPPINFTLISSPSLAKPTPSPG